MNEMEVLKSKQLSSHATGHYASCQFLTSHAQATLASTHLPLHKTQTLTSKINLTSLHQQHSSAFTHTSISYILLCHNSQAMFKKNSVSFVILAALFSFSLISISVTSEEEGAWPTSLVVKREQRKRVVSTEYGEITAARIAAGGRNGSYLLHSFTLEPNALFLPVMLHADMVFYVHTGSGKLSWTEDDELKTSNLVRGDVYRLQEGSIFFVQSNLETTDTERHKLRIHAIFSNSNFELHEPSVGPYSSIRDLITGFDRKVLQAAFRVPSALIDELLGGTKPPAFIHGVTASKESLWNKEAEFLRAILGSRTYNMFELNKKKKDDDADLFNIFKEDKGFENCNGWSTAVTRKQLPALRGSNIGVFMVNLTVGSMMGPHWNPIAAEIALVLQGQGMVRVVCANVVNETSCRNMRFHVKEGDVFAVPRFHPMAQLAFNNETLVFMGFSTSTEDNHPQYLAGQASVLRTLDKDVVAMALNVSNTTLEQFLAPQHESIILACTSCAEEELRVMQQEMEKEREKIREKEREAEREREEEKRRAEEEARKAEEAAAKKQEEERKKREEEAAKREAEARKRQEEEAARKKAEAEAKRKQEEEERKREEQEAQAEAERQRQEAEAAAQRERERQKAEEEAAKQEEQRRQQEAQEAERQRQEAEAAAERERERKRQEAEATAERERERQKAEEEAARQEEQRRQQEAQEAETERQKAEAAAQKERERQKAEEEAKRQEEQRAAAERERESQKAEEEAAREEEQRRQQEAQGAERQRQEAEAAAQRERERQRQEAEAAAQRERERQTAEEEASRQQEQRRQQEQQEAERHRQEAGAAAQRERQQAEEAAARQEEERRQEQQEAESQRQHVEEEAAHRQEEQRQQSEAEETAARHRHEQESRGQGGGSEEEQAAAEGQRSMEEEVRRQEETARRARQQQGPGGGYTWLQNDLKRIRW